MKSKKIKAFLELGRVSNLPTCISNVTAGFYLGSRGEIQDPASWVASLLSILCLYESGMVLNSILDFKIDQIERPLRPIPSGRVSLLEAWILYFIFMSLAVFFTAFFCSQAMSIIMLLILFIISYNIFHAKYLWSTLVMGACRGTTYVIAAIFGGEVRPTNTTLFLALFLTLYITAVSLFARNELNASNSSRQNFFFIMAMITLFSPLMIPSTFGSRLQIVTTIIPVFWVIYLIFCLGKKRLTPQGLVGKLLASISLFDAIILAQLQSTIGVALAFGCFASTLHWQRKISST